MSMAEFREALLTKLQRMDPVITARDRVAKLKQYKSVAAYTNILLNIKQVLLDSFSSKLMQGEDKHKTLDQSSQPRTNPEASKQYSDSFPLISFKSQQVMSPTAASAMLEPEKRTLLLTGENYTLWAFWMRGRLLKKGLGVICSEDEKDSRLTPEKEAEAFDLLLSSMSESTLSRVLTVTSTRDLWVILRKLYDTRMGLQLKITSTV